MPLEMANEFCCSLGMKLASFETKRELECLANKIKNYTSMKLYQLPNALNPMFAVDD
jgi:hypothetical protein